MSLAFSRTPVFLSRGVVLMRGCCFSVQLTVPLCVKASFSVFSSVSTAENILHQHRHCCLLCTDSESTL